MLRKALRIVYAVIVKTKFLIILEKEENGTYSVFVPALPGCYSQGDTVEDAMENSKEAIECYIESLKKDGISIPKQSQELIGEVQVAV